MIGVGWLGIHFNLSWVYNAKVPVLLEKTTGVVNKNKIPATPSEFGGQRNTEEMLI